MVVGDFGMLHGAYAYVGVVGFRPGQRAIDAETGNAHEAEVEFARWLTATTETVSVLASPSRAHRTRPRVRRHHVDDPRRVVGGCGLPHRQEGGGTPAVGLSHPLVFGRATDGRQFRPVATPPPSAPER
jgi:hypothetical protein